MNLQGFWSHSHDMPCKKKLHMSRDQLGEDLYQEAAAFLEIPRVHVALFLLQFRKTSKQTRFKWIPADMALRSHVPPHGAPHSYSCEPHFVVLCMAAKVYDPITLKPMTRDVDILQGAENLLSE